MGADRTIVHLAVRRANSRDIRTLCEHSAVPSRCSERVTDDDRLVTCVLCLEIIDVISQEGM
jgi:hypothetical protein